MPHLTVDPAVLVTLYDTRKWSLRKIADALGVSHVTVRYHLTRLGVTLRNRSEAAFVDYAQRAKHAKRNR